jgi:hypothetical protein
MSDLDDQIRQALQAEDAELFAEFGGEQTLLQVVSDTFKGRRRWLVALNAFWILVFFILGIVTAVKFFRADETRDIVMWAGACILCVSAVSMMKTWYFMEMNKNQLTREIKRVELQIARLARRIRE